MTVKKRSGGCYEDKKSLSTLSATLIQESGSVEEDFGKFWTTDAFTLVLYVLSKYQSSP